MFEYTILFLLWAVIGYTALSAGQGVWRYVRDCVFMPRDSQSTDNSSDGGQILYIPPTGKDQLSLVEDLRAQIGEQNKYIKELQARIMKLGNSLKKAKGNLR